MADATLEEIVSPTAVLRCTLDTLKLEDRALYSYVLTFEVEEPGRVTRTGKAIPVITWQEGAMGVAGSAVVKKTLIETAERYVDQFSNDYLAANP